MNNLVNERAGSKQIWKGINCITNNNVCKRPPPITEIDATKINNHFNSVPKVTVKCDKTNENDLSMLKDYCRKKDIYQSAYVPFISVTKVYQYLISLKQSNTRGLDNIDSKILKISAPIIADSLTFIYNLPPQYM